LMGDKAMGNKAREKVMADNVYQDFYCLRD
jgi:hypothetical protein